MSIFKKLANWFRGVDEYDDDEDGYIDDSESDTDQRSGRRDRGDKNGDRVLKINTKTRLMVTLVKPKEFDECRDIANSLKQQNAVVLNLEDANPQTAGRIVDFLSGVAYANNGQIKRVSKSTFIITPYDVDISGMTSDDMDLEF